MCGLAESKSGNTCTKPDLALCQAGRGDIAARRGFKMNTILWVIEAIIDYLGFALIVAITIGKIFRGEGPIIEGSAEEV